MDLHYECPNADYALTREMRDGEVEFFMQAKKIFSK